MTTKQLWVRGSKIGGVHPAVARKLTRQGYAEETERGVELRPPLRNPLRVKRREVTVFPMLERKGRKLPENEPEHRVLNLYLESDNVSSNLEILTKEWGRVFARDWEILEWAKIDEEGEVESFSYPTVAEWLQRYDLQEYPTEKIHNTWIIRPEGDKEIYQKFWVAAHVPLPKRDPSDPDHFTRISPVRLDMGLAQVLLDDWW